MDLLHKPQDLDQAKDDLKGLSFEERLRKVLRKPIAPRESALLLDVSGSMADSIGPNQTKIGKLRELVRTMSDVRRFTFSTSAQEIDARDEIEEPNGGTALDRGLDCCKANGIKHVVLITDGEPNDEQAALRSAIGLKIDVFYVGPDNNTKAQDLLRRLAAQFGGSYGKVSLVMTKELGTAIRGLLPSANEPGKGTIAL